MKIRDILKENEVTLSFEIFPPKTDDKYESVERAAGKIAALKPHFMSVTYGAGGGTSKNTAALARELQMEHGTTMLAHLTCVSSTKDFVKERIAEYREKGIENIMALRGDISAEGRSVFDYNYASELITDIKSIDPDICIGGACYPEGHIESESPTEDIKNLRKKVDAGCDFLTTQMFFDNSTMFSFMYRIREAGINVPVLAGIMPITNKKQVARSVALSGATIPQRFRMIVDKFGDDPAKMEQAGVVYACEQIIDLISNGITHVHVYSMNKPRIAEGIMNTLSSII